eukprot:scaffold3808_cov222-Pinguiococcus_pyrenoidosus.AAC.4
MRTQNLRRLKRKSLKSSATLRALPFWLVIGLTSRGIPKQSLSIRSLFGGEKLQIIRRISTEMRTEAAGNWFGIGVLSA